MVLENVPKAIGFVYALVMIGVLAYLWYSGRWRRSIGWLMLLVSAALGFLIFSPVIPASSSSSCCGMSRLGAPWLSGLRGSWLSFS